MELCTETLEKEGCLLAVGSPLCIHMRLLRNSTPREQDCCFKEDWSGHTVTQRLPYVWLVPRGCVLFLHVFQRKIGPLSSASLILRLQQSVCPPPLTFINNFNQIGSVCNILSLRESSLKLSLNLQEYNKIYKAIYPTLFPYFLDMDGSF